MKKLPKIWTLGFCLLTSSAFADHDHGGRFAPPARGPAPHPVVVPPPRGGPVVPPRAEPRPVVPPPRVAPPPPAPHMIERPHVENGEHWRGHESGPHDTHYRVERPWAAGRFRGPIGHEHIYRVRRWDPVGRRFWLNGSYFAIAAWDLAYIHDWFWDSDEIVLYDDPDHPGWYLAYNSRTGNYVHVEYGGEGG